VNIPLALGDYKGRSPAANSMELVNMMSEQDVHGGTVPFFLTNTPGCEEFVVLPSAGEGRGGLMYSRYCVAVVGDTVYRISMNGSFSVSGQLRTSRGDLQFMENPDQICIVDGTDGYVYSKLTSKTIRITDFNFPNNPVACAFKDGYGVVVSGETGQFYVSSINDFTEWDALSFATAEFKPDNLVSCVASADSLFALGEKTTQVFYNSGNPTFPFDNRQGANITIGCGAKGSPAEGQNLTFFVDDNFQVRMFDGFIPRTISTPGIDYRLARISNPENLRGFFYAQDGHSFYVLLHKEICLAYDITTAQWHRRWSGISGRYRPNWISQFGNSVLAGDFSNGKIYKLSTDTFQDNATETGWVVSLRVVNNDMKMVVHDMLEIKVDAGTGPGDPQLWMQYRDDDGHTWSREKWRSLGKIGEFDRRVRWYALGQSRNRIYRIGGSGNSKRNLVSARLEGRPLGY
jgi:hypothetical protein